MMSLMYSDQVMYIFPNLYLKVLIIFFIVRIVLIEVQICSDVFD